MLRVDSDARLTIVHIVEYSGRLERQDFIVVIQVNMKLVVSKDATPDRRELDALVHPYPGWVNLARRFKRRDAGITTGIQSDDDPAKVEPPVACRCDRISLVPGSLIHGSEHVVVVDDIA